MKKLVLALQLFLMGLLTLSFSIIAIYWFKLSLPYIGVIALFSILILTLLKLSYDELRKEK